MVSPPHALLLERVLDACRVVAMISLARQLEMASVNAARLAAVKGELEARARATQAKRIGRKRGPVTETRTFLRDLLLARIPAGSDKAISLTQVVSLFADCDYLPTGISSALTALCETGEVKRTGSRRHYRYYIQP